MKMLTYFLALATGCSAPAADRCKDYRYQSQFCYAVAPAFTTPEGIAVDPSGQDVSPALVDRLTDEVETCLRQTFGDPPRLPPDVVRDGLCLFDTFDLPVDRSCLRVKVPSDWMPSCDGSQEVLPLPDAACRATGVSPPPDGLCREKGLVPTPECPCRWRAGIQDQRVIVTTPSFYLYKDPLIRIATSCDNPWGHPSLANCATPSTPPR